MAIDDGLFLPTTEILDTQQLGETQLSPEQMREIIIRIVQAFNDSNRAVNQKDTGIYSLLEFVNGQTFFPDPALDSTTAQPPEFRPVTRKVINFGALPDGPVNPVRSELHGITINAVTQPNITFTRIYDCATDKTTPEYIPLPYSSATLANNIELSVDATHVIVTGSGGGGGVDWSRFTHTYVVLEYLIS